MLQAHQAARAGQRAQQHGGEHPGVDVAAAEHDADVLVAEHARVLEQRGEPGRARALEDRLFDLGAERDRLLDALLGDDDDVVDELGDDARG